MGDRTSVTLSVPVEQLSAALEILERYDGVPESEEENDLSVDLQFSEVNYGDLRSEAHLTAAGIAWMKSWGPGGDYNAGTAWTMFNEHGDLIKFTYSDESAEETLRPYFDLLDEPEALIQALRIEKAKMTPPAWDNQVEYGKRYRTRNLIDPPLTNLCADIQI
jgi:hypothetical protein